MTEPKNPYEHKRIPEPSYEETMLPCHHPDIMPCFKDCPACAYEAGVKKVVDWLKAYAIHGKSVPLEEVIEDIETHSGLAEGGIE